MPLRLTLAVAVALSVSESVGDGLRVADADALARIVPELESVNDGDALGDDAALPVLDAAGERDGEPVTVSLALPRGEPVPEIVGAPERDADTEADAQSVSVAVPDTEPDPESVPDVDDTAVAVASEPEAEPDGQLEADLDARGEPLGVAAGEPERLVRGDAETDGQPEAERQSDAVVLAVRVFSASVADTHDVADTEKETVTEYDCELDAVRVGASDGEAHDESDSVYVADTVGDGEVEPESEGEPLGDGLRVGEPETEKEPESVKLGVAAPEFEVLALALAAPLLVPLALGVRDAVGDTLGEALVVASEAVATTLGVGLPERDTVLHSEAVVERVSVPDADAVGAFVTLPEPDRHALELAELDAAVLPVAAPLAEFDTETVREPVADVEKDTVGVELTVVEAAADVDTVRTGLALETVLALATETVRAADGEPLCVALTDALPDALIPEKVGAPDVVKEPVPVLDGELAPVGDTLDDAEPDSVDAALCEPEPDAAALGELLGELEPVDDAALDGVVADDKEIDGEPDAEGLGEALAMLALAVAEEQPLAETVGVLDMDGVYDSVAVDEAEPVAAPVADTLGVALIEKVALDVPLAVAESENVIVAVTDAEPEPERAGEADRSGLGDTVALAEPVATDTLARPDTVGVPDADSEGETETVTVPLGV